MAESSKVYIGMEGGASCTKGVLVNHEGTVLSRVVAKGTNHWNIGMPKTVEIILETVDGLMEKAGSEASVMSIGLSLSGVETPSCATAIASSLYDLRPKLIADGEKARVYNDLIAALETATNQGGIVLISGTGTNCCLVDTSTATSYNCGGWGHMIGDEGGAYFITHRALKTLFDHDDNMNVSKFNLDFIRQNMKEYFNVETNSDMLRHLYKSFDKSFVAGFTVNIAKGAEQGDGLCLSVFHEAGVQLGKHVLAVCGKSGKKKEEITIVCVGSVWKSWKYMSEALLATIEPLKGQYESMRLVRLTGDGAIGAAVAGARDTGHSFPIDYAEHTETICLVTKE